MTYREMSRKLKNLGCQETKHRTRGSHRKWFNPLTERATVIPDHGTNDMPIGTIRACIRQLGINWTDFKRA